MFVDLTENGYKIFREHIHQTCMTGNIHGIFIPIAILGFMYILSGLVGETGTKVVLYGILFFQTKSYYYIDPLVTIVNYIFYSIIIELCIRKRIKIGIVLMAISISMMEFYSHWYLEGRGSNLWHFFNSVFWTQLYGFRSLLNREVCY